MNNDEPNIPQPAQLWKRLSEEQKLKAAEAFWQDPEGLDQQVEAMTLLAQRLKARTRFVQGLPVEKKSRHLAHYPGMPDLLAARLLVSYHLAHQRSMMAAFLDAAGVAHDEGLITADPEGPIAADRIAPAVKALEASHGSEAVQLYLGTLLAQDPEVWAALAPHVTEPGAEQS